MYHNNTFSDEKMYFDYTFSWIALIFDKKNIKFIRFMHFGLKIRRFCHAEAFNGKTG